MNNSEKLILNASHWIVSKKLDFYGSIDYEKLNYNRLFELCRKHKMRMPLKNYLDISLKSKDSFLKKEMIKKFNKITNRKKQHLHYVIDVSNILRSEHIEHIFIKGIMQEYITYNSLNMRDLGDIDILLHDEDCERAYNVLHKHGYTQLYNDNPQVFKKQGGKYNWDCATVLTPEDKVIIELKNGCSAVRKNSDILFNYKKKVYIQNEEIITLDETALMVLVLSNTFNDNLGRDCMKIRLRNFMESWKIIDKCGITNKMVELSEILETRHKVYEVLQVINDLYHLDNEYQNQMKMFDIVESNYIHNIDGWGGSNSDCNGAVLFNKEKRDPIKILFEENYNVELFIKNFKKKYYSNIPAKTKMFNIEDMKFWIEYSELKGCYYKWNYNNDYLMMQIKISKKSGIIGNKNTIEFEWFEYDENKPNLMTGFNLDIDNAYSKRKSVIEYVGLPFYEPNSPLYNKSYEIWDMYNKIPIEVNVKEDKNYVTFNLELHINEHFFNNGVSSMLCQFSLINKYKMRYHYGIDNFGLYINNL